MTLHLNHGIFTSKPNHLYLSATNKPATLTPQQNPYPNPPSSKSLSALWRPSVFWPLLLSSHIPLPTSVLFEAGRVVFFWLYHTKCRILAPWSGIELVPPAVEAQSPNHWTTREVPPHLFYASAILNHSRFFQTTGASSHGGHCSSWFSTLDMSALQVCVNTHAVFPAFSTVWWDAPSAGSFSTIHLIPPFHSVYHNTTACSLACASLQTVGSLKPLADYFLCCI